MNTIAMLDMKNVLGKLAEGEIILDVRGADEFSGGHLPGARNIPHDQVAQHAGELKKFKVIYIHCQAGRRAGMAADTLAKLGLNNIICITGGGMGDWMAAGLPVER